MKTESRVEREEYHGETGQRGAVTGCEPPCGEAWEVRPGARGMQMPSGQPPLPAF